MATLNKRDILQEVLTEYGYSEWHVIEPSRFNQANFVFNPKEKKIGEVSIPDAWLDDKSQRSTIGESLTLTIQNSRYFPHGHEENPSNENSVLPAPDEQLSSDAPLNPYFPVNPYFPPVNPYFPKIV